MPTVRSVAAPDALAAAAHAANAQRVSSTTPLRINALRAQPTGGTPRLCITGAAPAAASSPAADAAAAAAAARRVSSTPPIRISAPQPRPAAGGGMPAPVPAPAAAPTHKASTPAAKPQGRAASSNLSVSKRQIRPLQLADDKGGSVRKASETARPLCISRAPKDSQSDWEELSEPQGHSAVARPQPVAPAPDPPDARTLAPERAARGGRAAAAPTDAAATAAAAATRGGAGRRAAAPATVHDAPMARELSQRPEAAAAEAAAAAEQAEHAEAHDGCAASAPASGVASGAS